MQWSRERPSPAALLIVLFSFLALLRLVPAVIRKAVPFSPAAKSIWGERRGLGKRYDSYQWQKLFWIGIGMLAYSAVSDRYAGAQVALASGCVISGALGWLQWRRIVNGIKARQRAGISQTELHASGAAR
jgi:hypothetical protein